MWFVEKKNSTFLRTIRAGKNTYVAMKSSWKSRECNYHIGAPLPHHTAPAMRSYLVCERSQKRRCCWRRSGWAAQKTQKNSGLMLGRRRRRWPHIKPTLAQRLVFALKQCQGEPEKMTDFLLYFRLLRANDLHVSHLEYKPVKKHFVGGQ